MSTSASSLIQVRNGSVLAWNHHVRWPWSDFFGIRRNKKAACVLVLDHLLVSVRPQIMSFFRGTQALFRKEGEEEDEKTRQNVFASLWSPIFQAHGLPLKAHDCDRGLDFCGSDCFTQIHALLVQFYLWWLHGGGLARRAARLGLSDIIFLMSETVLDQDGWRIWLSAAFSAAVVSVMMTALHFRPNECDPCFSSWHLSALRYSGSAPKSKLDEMISQQNSFWGTLSFWFVPVMFYQKVGLRYVANLFQPVCKKSCRSDDNPGTILCYSDDTLRNYERELLLFSDDRGERSLTT